MKPKLQRVLVTGGAGFIGSHLVDRLVALGVDVTILDNFSTGLRKNLNSKARVVEGDVRDRDLVARLIADSDACFHLAAIASVWQCTENPVESHAVNFLAFVDLLDAVGRRVGGVIPVVYASSAAVYGNIAVPAHEHISPNPLSSYGKDKAGCEAAARDAGVKYAVPTFGLRPFNIYGARQHPTSPYSGVISIFVDRLRRGEAVTIYGDGGQSRDFIAAHDVVEFFIAALEKAAPSAPVCNAATGKETSVLDLAHKIAHILSITPSIAFAPARADDIYRSVADISQARLILGYTAQTEVDEGLRSILL